MTSPLKQGAVCPECFTVLGDEICVWNNHVYTVLWNRYAYTAVTTLLLCIVGRFHSLLLCPSVFFHAAHCERSHQKVVEYFPGFLSFLHNIRSELHFQRAVGFQTRSTEDPWEVPDAICISSGTGTCAQLKLSRDN